LNLSKPYRAGDWISLDNGVDGQVLEMNWRATHMLTIKHDIVIVPNSVVAKSKIVVSSTPSRAHGTTITVLLGPNTFPLTARRLIAEAIHGCPLALINPSPTIVIKSMSLESIAADITFFTSGFSESLNAQNQVYEKIFRRLGCAGIGLGSSTTAIQVIGNLNSTDGLSELDRLLVYTPMFSRLSPTERTTIAGSMTRETFDAGKTVMEAGVKSESMYIVASGVLSCSSEVGSRNRELTRMSAADHFGAEALIGERLTGFKVSALTTAILYRLGKADLTRIIEASPGFAAGLNRELAARRLLSSTVENQDVGEHSEESLAEWFSSLFRRPESAPDSHTNQEVSN
jgi:CRP-like cAMP-binding protein